MRIFKATLTGMLIRELKLIFSLIGKLIIYLSLLSYLDIIELNSQINDIGDSLIFVGFGAYLISFSISKLYLVLQARYDNNKGF
jgi:hypothetical protein